jgi:flagellar biosynthesis/type III secretory pathway protein FliH
MSNNRNSSFPWAPLPRRMTPKPMPSWIAPRKISSTVMPSVRAPSPAGVPTEAKRARTQAPPAPNPAEAELAPVSTHETKFNVLVEESPELEALRQQNMQLEQTIAEAIGESCRMRRKILEESEGELVKLAIAIAQQIVGRELRANPELATDWAKEAIEQLASDDAVTIAISPEVEPLLTPEKWLQIVPGVTVVVDQALQAGQTQVRSLHTRIGAGRVERAAAVIEALGELAK